MKTAAEIIAYLEAEMSEANHQEHRPQQNISIQVKTKKGV